MSLATRCPACATVFRVVQDQLKVADGWVRCGRCQEVFNARAALFDLERDRLPDEKAPIPPATSPLPPADAGEAEAPAAVSQPAPAPEPAVAVPPPEPAAAAPQPPLPLEPAAVAAHPPAPEPAVAAPPTAPEPAAHDEAVDAGFEDADDARDDVLLGRRGTHGPTPAEGVAARDRLDFMDARFNLELLSDGTPDDAPPLGEETEPSLEPSAEPLLDAPPAPDPSAATPGFVRQADRRARRDRRGVRVLLGVAAVALLLVLAAQLAVAWRDTLAAHWPATRALLVRACERLDCRVQAPRGIEDLAVESTALTRLGSDAQTARLSVVLRNRAAQPRRMPSVELSLTDSSGRLVARRVLSPADFHVAQPAIPAGAEITLETALGSSRPVNGYTIEIFYP